MNAILLVSLAAGLMFTAERILPGRHWPRVRGWWSRALMFSLVQGGIIVLAGLTWERWLPQRTGWGDTSTQLAVSALAGYLVLTFVYYWWHRARHEVPWLWRWLHQLHHSPQRIEIVTSFYKHPFEIAANSLLSSLVLYGLVGLSPEAAWITVLISGLAELFYHWNVRTPYWLGFLIQRPESHCVHHQRGHHSANYADLPMWDWLFGTLDNPRQVKPHCGFAGEQELRIRDMLLGRDVSQLEKRP